MVFIECLLIFYWIFEPPICVRSWSVRIRCDSKKQRNQQKNSLTPHSWCGLYRALDRLCAMPTSLETSSPSPCVVSDPLRKFVLTCSVHSLYVYWVIVKKSLFIWLQGVVVVSCGIFHCDTQTLLVTRGFRSCSTRTPECVDLLAPRHVGS